MKQTETLQLLITDYNIIVSTAGIYCLTTHLFNKFVCERASTIEREKQHFWRHHGILEHNTDTQRIRGHGSAGKSPELQGEFLQGNIRYACINLQYVMNKVVRIGFNCHIPIAFC